VTETNPGLSGGDGRPTGFAALRRAVEELFPGYFALVMATGIVSLAAHGQDMPAVARGLLYLNGCFYLVLWLLTLARILIAGPRFVRDLLSHGTAPSFLTTVAATCVLGTQCVLIADMPILAMVLWALGGALWVVLIYTFFTVVSVSSRKPSLKDGLNGGWLLTVVSTQSVAVLGAVLAPRLGVAGEPVLFAMLCLFLLGCMLYLLVISLIFYRFTFFVLEPADLGPPYWINMGAIAITTLAGARLLGRADDAPFLSELHPFLRGFTLFFWATATWWIPLLVLLGIWRHGVRRFPLSYHPTFWSLVFPLGMYTVATYQLALVLDLPFLLTIPRYFVYVAMGAWLVVFLGMVVRIVSRLRGRVPESLEASSSPKQ